MNAEHPEYTCEDCGKGNVSWHTDSKLWNAVCRPPGYLMDPMLCPRCFALRAEQAGHNGHWVLVFEPSVAVDTLKVHNWKELSELANSNTHMIRLNMTLRNGWILPLRDSEIGRFYLTTHTFYGGAATRLANEALKRYGFNVEIIGAK